MLGFADRIGVHCFLIVLVLLPLNKYSVSTRIDEGINMNKLISQIKAIVCRFCRKLIYCLEKRERNISKQIRDKYICHLNIIIVISLFM